MFALIIESFHPAKPIVCPKGARRSTPGERKGSPWLSFSPGETIGFPWANDSKDLMFESAVPYIHPSSSFSF